MGGGVSILAPSNPEHIMRELVGNKKKMGKLFKVIASSGGKSGKIDLANSGKV